MTEYKRDIVGLQRYVYVMMLAFFLFCSFRYYLVDSHRKQQLLLWELSLLWTYNHAFLSRM